MQGIASIGIKDEKKYRKDEYSGSYVALFAIEVTLNAIYNILSF